jgi:signal peptidase I
MEPTILKGERFLCDMRYFKNHEIVPRELAVSSYDLLPNETYVHRCSAIEGQTVEVIDGNPFVDKKPIWNYGAPLRYMPILPKSNKESDIFPKGAGNSDNYGPVIVPKGKYFMFSDNIPNSRDSRNFGFVDKRNVKGRPIFVLWSPNISRIGSCLK